MLQESVDMIFSTCSDVGESPEHLFENLDLLVLNHQLIKCIETTVEEKQVDILRC